ncbi:hypothetical protein Dacsa_2164 [Dactylococcopsis salina PCC 8305]|uniref:Uncharacterized protein n=2 Tax=Dactylococcopsis salina TaxID=292566 RepID=K9YXG7_DACS8|nr:hypothetical protein Dacsa_2164 [Dactylococcopsis salina PCC 8305]
MSSFVARCREATALRASRPLPQTLIAPPPQTSIAPPSSNPDRAPSLKPRCWSEATALQASHSELEFLTPIIYNRLVGSSLLIL